jgi:uncharacterized repeat protein (TIGR03803 family)
MPGAAVCDGLLLLCKEDALLMKTTCYPRNGRFFFLFETTLSALALLATLQPQESRAETFRVLHSFAGGTGAADPRDSVALDGAGNLYGTSEFGGVFHQGTVYKVDPTGTETVLHSFAGGPSDGANPWGAVTLDRGGNIYGSTYVGGRFEYGVIYKLAPDGSETILHDFGGLTRNDGGACFARLLRDRAGNLYGPALEGGSRGWGEIFRLDGIGNITALHSFTGGADGGEPRGELAHDRAGNLYGTAEFGGAFDFGTVYKIDATGSFTVLHSFNEQDGSLPYGGVVLDRAGNLYGTTIVGGSFSQGVVFKLTPAGAYTILHTFRSTDGAQPLASLLRDAAGNIYGSTTLGGTFGDGVIFKLDAAGNYSVLHNFNGEDGEEPAGALVRDRAGNLYGTTYEGGAFDAGVIFVLTP